MKHKKDQQNVKVYCLNQGGKYVEEDHTAYEKSSKDMIFYPYVAQAETNVHQEKKSSVKENTNFQDILHRNPYFYSLNNQDSLEIDSIEDFYIQYHKKEYTFEEVLRGNLFSKRKRNRIIKKALNRWYKDANTNQQEILFRGQEEIKNAKIDSPNKVHLFSFFFYVLSLVLCIVLFRHFISYLPPLKDVEVKVMTCVVFFVFLGMILGAFQRMQVHLYEENLSESKKIYNQYRKEIQKEFKVKSAKTKKYYIKGLKRKKFEKSPLAIEKTAIACEKLYYIDQLSTKMSKDSMKVLQRNRKLNLLYRIPTLLSYLCIVSTLGYTIGSLVYALIQNIS